MLLVAQTNGNMEPLSCKLETVKKGTYTNRADWKETKFALSINLMIISSSWKIILQLEIDFNTKCMRINL